MTQGLLVIYPWDRGLETPCAPEKTHTRRVGHDARVIAHD